MFFRFLRNGVVRDCKEREENRKFDRFGVLVVEKWLKENFYFLGVLVWVGKYLGSYWRLVRFFIKFCGVRLGFGFGFKEFEISRC